MTIEFEAEIWYWRGPAPFYFATVPDEQAAEIKAIASAVTYGWGMIPAKVRVGQTTWQTSLWPKDGSYIVPLKDKIRKAEQLVEGQTIHVRLDVG